MLLNEQWLINNNIKFKKLKRGKIHIYEHLRLRGDTKITELPDDLVVVYEIHLLHTKIKKLPVRLNAQAVYIFLSQFTKSI